MDAHKQPRDRVSVDKEPAYLKSLKKGFKRFEESPAQPAKVEAAPQPEKKPAGKPVKVAKEKAPSLSRALRDIVVREPKVSVDDLFDRLVKKGFTGRSKVTIATLRSDALQTLEAAKAAGLYSVEM